MSIKYLNLSGLEDLWINIKNYILSKIPTKTSELTNDSGYLTSHQSLDNYVTLNSGQTITAIKTITGGNQGKMLFKNPNYTKGDAVESSTVVSRLYFGNGASYSTANGVLTTDINSEGNTSMELCAINNTASNSNRASLILTYDKSATRPRLLKSWGDFIPNSNDGYSLGNTSNIWKECYSNAYYLGSTAFGDIVTHNASEFLTSHQSLTDYVKFTDCTSDRMTAVWGKVLRVDAGSGLTEIGKYIDFHAVADDTIDYAVRLEAVNASSPANGNGSLKISATSGVLPSANNKIPLGTSSLRWKECYSNAYYLGTTAFGDIVTHNASEFLTSHQSLANYVTTNTDQSISGIKSHSKHISILGDYLGNEYSTNARTCLYLKSNRDTDGKSGIYFSKFRQNRAQGALTGSDLVDLSLDVLENSVRTNSCISISFRYFENDVPTKIYVIPKASMTSYMGTANNPWTNAYITNLNLNGNAFDPTSIDGVGTVKLLAYAPTSSQEYTMNAGTIKAGSNLGEVWAFHASSDSVAYLNSNMSTTQSGTWKLLNFVSVGGNPVGCKVIGLWVRIA